MIQMQTVAAMNCLALNSCENELVEQTDFQGCPDYGFFCARLADYGIWRIPGQIRDHLLELLKKGTDLSIGRLIGTYA